MAEAAAGTGDARGFDVRRRTVVTTVRLKENDEVDDGALQAEVDRLNALPLPRLASEVMTKAFGPVGLCPDEHTGPERGPANDHGVGDVTIAMEFAQTRKFVYGNAGLQACLERLVAEALQALEHASLVRTRFHNRDSGSVNYHATRLGRTALERGAVDRILEGGSL